MPSFFNLPSLCAASVVTLLASEFSSKIFSFPVRFYSFILYNVFTPRSDFIPPATITPKTNTGSTLCANVWRLCEDREPPAVHFNPFGPPPLSAICPYTECRICLNVKVCVLSLSSALISPMPFQSILSFPFFHIVVTLDRCNSRYRIVGVWYALTAYRQAAVFVLVAFSACILFTLIGEPSQPLLSAPRSLVSVSIWPSCGCPLLTLCSVNLLFWYASPSTPSLPSSSCMQGCWFSS